MRVILVLSFLILSACAHSVHQSHTSDFKNMKPGARQVEAKSEQFSILGFKTETDYVEKAFNDLKKQCNGRITGITTKYSTSLGFFSWTNKIKMSGYCI